MNNSLAELHLQRTSDANKINIIMCHPSKISANFFAHLTVSRGTTNFFFFVFVVASSSGHNRQPPFLIDWQLVNS